LKLAEYTEKLLAGETIAERAEMKKLINDVENKKWRGVLVMEVERLARGDTSDQGIIEAAFKYSGTKIITPVKTYEPNNEMDEEIFAFGLFASTIPDLLLSSPPITEGISLISILLPFFNMSTAVQLKNALFTSTCNICLSILSPNHLLYIIKQLFFCQVVFAFSVNLWYNEYVRL